MIRPATVADIPALLEMGRQFMEFNAYRAHAPLCEHSLAATLHSLIVEHELLVLDVDGVAQGCAGAMIAPVYWNRDVLQALELFWWVNPAHRGNGTGKALREELQATVRARGVTIWNMVALEDSMRDQVCAMYERAGMVPVERIYARVF